MVKLGQERKECGGGGEYKERKGWGSMKGWYLIPCYCPVGTTEEERPIAPGELFQFPAEARDWAWPMAAGASGTKTSIT